MRTFVLILAGTLFILQTGCKKDSQTDVNTDLPDLMQNSSVYSGNFPMPKYLDCQVEGQDKKVRCFDGQLIVFFGNSVDETHAKGILESLGGSILEKVPCTGYYLVDPGSKGMKNYMIQLQLNDSVQLALPNIAGYLRSGAAILDHCGFSHGQKVLETLQSCGGTFDECVKVTAESGIGNQNGEPTALNKVIKGILDEANENKSGPTLINLSSNGGLENNVNFDSIPLEMQQEGLNGWFTFMQGVLMTIAALPDEFRANLVVTIAAGNENMPIDGLLSQLRQRERLTEVLAKNVLIVSTALVEPGANYAPQDPDVVVMNNDSSLYGTSLAAPCAMGMLQTVMQERGVSPGEALQLVKQASLNNPNRELAWSDLLPLIQYAMEATTVTFGPYMQHNGPYICYQTLNFDIQPTLFWRAQRGNLTIPAHYYRLATGGSGCVMSGITEDDNTITLLLSGSDTYIHGLGTAHFLSGGTNEQGVCIGFDCVTVFEGQLNSNGNITGNLKMTLEVMGNFGDSVTVPLTLAKQ